MQISVKGLPVNYEEINPQGTTTLVILHGWASSGEFWLPVAKSLSKNIRVILPDLPGFGQTPPIDNTPNIPEYTQFIKDFVRALDLPPFILAGHSFGGQITLDYAFKYPKTLKSIILIAPVAVLKKTNDLKLKLTLVDKVRPILSRPSNSVFEHALGWSTPTEYINSSEYQKKVLRKIISYDLDPFLHQILVPADIIWGNKDTVVPNTGKYMAQKISHSHLHLIPGAGHLVNLTHTQKLSEILNRIISSSRSN